MVKNDPGKGLQSKRTFTRNLIAGVAALGGLVVFLWNNFEEIQNVIGPLFHLPAPSEPKLGVLEGRSWFIHVNDNGTLHPGNEGKVQTFECRFKGDVNVAGRCKDVGGHAEWELSGYLRAEALSLSYGSLDRSRPGFGGFITREWKSQDPNVPPYFAGLAVGHDCDTPTGGVCVDGPIISCPAILSDQRQPTAEQLQSYFGRRCVLSDAIWPRDVEKKSASLVKNVHNASAE
jgi:hypothetical protein